MAINNSVYSADHDINVTYWKIDAWHIQRNSFYKTPIAGATGRAIVRLLGYVNKSASDGGANPLCHRDVTVHFGASVISSYYAPGAHREPWESAEYFHLDGSPDAHSRSISHPADKPIDVCNAPTDHPTIDDLYKAIMATADFAGSTLI